MSDSSPFSYFIISHTIGSILKKLFINTMYASDVTIRHFSLLNVKFAGACGYDFVCDGRRLVRAYLGRRRGAI